MLYRRVSLKPYEVDSIFVQIVSVHHIALCVRCQRPRNFGVNIRSRQRTMKVNIMVLKRHLLPLFYTIYA